MWFLVVKSHNKGVMALRKKTKTIDFSMFFQSIDSFFQMNGIDLSINLIKILLLRVLIRGMDRKLVTNQQKNRSISNTVKFNS